MLRFGLIAGSSIARRRFLPALKNSPSARLERIGSRAVSKAAALAQEHGAKKSGTYDEVLNDPEVDAVYISTPISQHAEWVRRAAVQGKHILCEKPLCPGSDETAALVEFCREKKVRLLEGYSFRFHPQHALARQAITENRIGTPLFFSGEFTFPKPPAGDIRLQPAMNGGVFHDAAGYPVAAAMMMFAAAPTTVSCHLEMDAESGVDRAAALCLTFPGGAIAHCFIGFGLHYRSRYSVMGTHGRIEAERAYSVLPDKATTLWLEQDKEAQRIEVPPVDQFQLMIEEFAGQISRLRPRTDWEQEALQQALVMDAAFRAARIGGPVTVPSLRG